MSRALSRCLGEHETAFFPLRIISGVLTYSPTPYKNMPTEHRQIGIFLYTDILIFPHLVLLDLYYSCRVNVFISGILIRMRNIYRLMKLRVHVQYGKGV